MKTILIVLFLFNGTVSLAQVTTVDVVRVKGEYEKEAVYFYESNWKVFREVALKEKYISGFELVKSPVDSAGVFTMLLVTNFPDSLSYVNVEKNFRGVIQSVAPKGPKMLNAVSRKDFILGVTSYSGKALVRSK